MLNCGATFKSVSPRRSARNPTHPFINMEGGLRPYTGTGISGGIHALFKAADVEVQRERRRPRIHDLRHTLPLARSSVGISRVPMCSPICRSWRSTWVMSPSCRPHIICTFFPKLRAIASDRFESAYGGLIREAVV